MRAVILMAFVFASAACTNPDRTVEAASKAGFTHVVALGYAWFQCGQDDTWHTKFTGTNSQGLRVEGAVCCGVLKGCTVRF